MGRREVAVVAWLCVGLAAGPAHAKGVKRIGLQNATGRPAAKAVLEFAGEEKVKVTGPISVFPNHAGCGVPKVDTEGRTSASITWGAACVQPWSTVWCTAESRTEALVFLRGVWVGAQDDTLGLIVPADVEVSEMVTRPVIPPTVLYALLAAVALDAGLIAFLVMTRRRRPLPPAA